MDDITWETYEYGRHGELTRLNKVRNDHTKPAFIRKQAGAAHATIVKQLRNPKLMSLRERLIRASLAGDEYEMAKIQQMMKDLMHEDRETGSYHQR